MYRRMYMFLYTYTHTYPHRSSHSYSHMTPLTKEPEAKLLEPPCRLSRYCPCASVGSARAFSFFYRLTGFADNVLGFVVIITCHPGST